MEDLRAIESARQEGRSIPGVFLLEPMPYNQRRLDLAFAKDFLALEIPADTKAPMRPLTGLQVWLFGSAANSEWVLSLASLVLSVNPAGLYVQWVGQADAELSHVLVRNPRVDGKHADPTLDLYDMVRIDGPIARTTVEEAEKRMARVVADATKDVPPPAAPKPVAKLDPGWGDDDE